MSLKMRFNKNHPIKVLCNVPRKNLNGCVDCGLESVLDSFPATLACNQDYYSFPVSVAQWG